MCASLWLSHRDGEFSFLRESFFSFPLYKPRLGCSETMGYGLEPPNPERCHRAGAGPGEESVNGHVCVGEDAVKRDNERAMWDKTTKRGKEFSSGEQHPRLD